MTVFLCLLCIVHFFYFFFFFSSRRRHTRCSRDWSSDVCSSDLTRSGDVFLEKNRNVCVRLASRIRTTRTSSTMPRTILRSTSLDRKSTRLNSSHGYISYAVFCLKKKKNHNDADLHIGTGRL